MNTFPGHWLAQGTGRGAPHDGMQRANRRSKQTSGQHTVSCHHRLPPGCHMPCIMAAGAAAQPRHLCFNTVPRMLMHHSKAQHPSLVVAAHQHKEIFSSRPPPQQYLPNSQPQQLPAHSPVCACCCAAGQYVNFTLKASHRMLQAPSFCNVFDAASQDSLQVDKPATCIGCNPAAQSHMTIRICC